MTDPKYSTKSIGKILEPKQIEVNVEYAFTINPCDEYQFWKESGSERIKKSVDHMKRLITSYPNINMNMYIDFSKTGRIHWHGFLLFRHIDNIKYWYEEVVHKISFTHNLDMDTIKDRNVWFLYCTKVQHLWSQQISTDEVFKKSMQTPILHGGHAVVKNGEVIAKYKDITECFENGKPQKKTRKKKSE